MATTTRLGDYLGRALHNDNPGSSTATDFLGRNVAASNKDGLGRDLVTAPNFPPPDRANSTAYTTGQRVKVKGTDEVQTLTVTATGGNFKLSVTLAGSTQTTANIAVVGLSAANIQSAIVALSNVEPGDVTVTGGASPYTVTIQSEQGNVGQIAVVAGSPDVSGGTVVAGTTTQGATGGQIYEATTSGTSSGSVPTLPAVGATVTDGGVTWRRLK
jgi:hypothetical protein